jgi:hypothetical protein
MLAFGRFSTLGSKGRPASLMGHPAVPSTRPPNPHRASLSVIPRATLDIEMDLDGDRV